jgi:hypothetical protein
MKMLEKHRKYVYSSFPLILVLTLFYSELYDLSISFKKMYKEPMELAIKNLPAKVEKSIEQVQ